MLEQLKKYRFHISLAVLIIYYSVGIRLLQTGGNKEEIIALTPFTLLFTLIVLLFNHTHWKKRVMLALMLVAVLGFFVEVLGTRTGVPFGSYSYSDVLGIKVMGTPLIMGINWVLLVYAGTMLFHPLNIPGWLKPVLTGGSLVLLDIFIEPFAIKWNLWQWQETVPPAQNYVSWAIIAVLFSWLLNRSLSRSMRNKLALPVLVIQLLFFLILSK